MRQITASITFLGILTTASLTLNSPPIARAEGVATPAKPHDHRNAIVISFDSQAEATAAEVPEKALPTVHIPLTNVTDVIMDGAAAEVGSNQERLYNMRIKSDQTSLTDYLRIKYVFKKNDQKLKPSQIVKYGNIGVFNSPYFAKNVTHEIHMSYGQTTLSMGQDYFLTSTSSTVFRMNLEAGQVISFLVQSQSDDYRIKITNPYGETILLETLTANTGVITSEIPILATGTHTIKFIPVHDSSLTLYATFLNANRQDLATVKEGDYISNSFYSNLRDYAKYAIDLAAGEELTVTGPGDSNIRLTLINSRNAVVDQVDGLPILYEAPSSGRYYLFINNSRGWGGSYSGTIHVH